jgi:ankyrin repeat protein
VSQLSDAFSANMAFLAFLACSSSPNGFTYVHAAISQNYQALISILADLKPGIVNQASKHGWTPLHEAMYRNRIDCARELLKRGAVSTLNKVVSFSGFFMTPLGVSVVRSHHKMVEFLLSQKPNLRVAEARNSGMTVAHLAVLYENRRCSTPSILKLLLAAAPELANVQNSEGLTPLHFATYLGDTGAIRDLIACRADLDKIDESGRTALHFAWAQIHFKSDPDLRKSEDFLHSRELLLWAGADPDIQDIYGLTPSRLAFFPYLVPKFNGGNQRFGSELSLWEGAISSCPDAWHSAR